jgi:hypothetical protein
LWFDGVVSPEGPFANIMKNAQGAFEDSFRTMSDEALHFINRRLEHNGEIIEQCRDCKDVSALMTAQQKWFMDMARDYYDEAMRMGEVSRKVFANSLPANGESAQPKHADKPGQV